MAEQFLSCDGNFIHVPKDHFKKKDPNMISISTISASLSTDDSSLLRRKIPEPKLCCFFPINTVSIFAVTFTCLLVLAMYIYLIVIVVQNQNPEFHKEKMIVLLSIIACIVLIFGSLFAWGILGKRKGFLLPHIILSTFLLFALSGVTIFSFLTAADEVKQVSKEGDDGKIVNLFLFRIHRKIYKKLHFRGVLTALTLLQAFFLYIFIRSYLYLRRVARER